jgi:predicted nucleotidyltransferase
MNKNKINKNDEIEKLKPIIIKILKQKGIKKAAIFGSYARGDQKKDSDIDILIEPPKGMGLEFFGLNLELEKELGLKVDLLTYNSINCHIKEYILADEVRII